MSLTYSKLLDYVSTYAGIRAITELEPLAGPGTKVFPPTYGVDDSAAIKYAVERRTIPTPDNDATVEVDAVVLDSVAAQAHKFAGAILEAWEAGELELPIIGADFTAVDGLEEYSVITDLEAPHRVYDAINRDSLDGDVPFRFSPIGKAVTEATVANATALYVHSPSALLFGAWDSTGPKGGRGSKFERAITSEIVATDITVGRKTSSRIDPLGIEKKAGTIYVRADGSWTLDMDEAGKKSKQVEPSAILHGNVRPSIDSRAGGVTAGRIEATTVISLIQLRRLKFPKAPDGSAFNREQASKATTAARATLAALGLAATALAFERGFDLRSRCVLAPTNDLEFEAVGRTGTAEKFALSGKEGLALVAEATDAGRRGTAVARWPTPVDAHRAPRRTGSSKSGSRNQLPAGGEMMLAVEMTLLGGRYRASSFENRRVPEWPPHPARLFYAAVDAVYSSSEVDEAEVAILRWWEALGAPQIACSDAFENVRGGAVAIRDVLDHYVPGNSAGSWSRDIQTQWAPIADSEATLAAVRDSGSARDLAKAQRALEKAMEKLRAETVRVTRHTGEESAQVAREARTVLPEHRIRQARTFPSVCPDDPRVHFIWPEAQVSDNQRAALDAVLARIGRVGHSASTVSCRIVDHPPEPVWISTDSPVAGCELRTTDYGVIDALKQEYARHGGYRERVLPALVTSYQRLSVSVEQLITQDEIGDWIVLPFEARQQLPLSRTHDITRSVRAAMISHAAQPVSSIISGHSDGTGSTELKSPHMSVLVLPNVTHVYSDGYIQAVAIGLPDDATAEDRAAVLDALGRWSGNSKTSGYDLTLPGGALRRLQPAVFDAGAFVRSRPGIVASRQFWARSGSDWSSVTPVALDRHPRVAKNPDYDELNAAVTPLVDEMCRKVGLPTPVEVVASPVSAWSAVPPVQVGGGRNRRGRSGFPQYSVGGRRDRRRFTTHVSMRFEEPVRGPIVIGAGRYFGYGLMLPSPGSGSGTR